MCKEWISSIKQSLRQYKAINGVLFWIAVISFVITILGLLLSVKWALDTDAANNQITAQLDNVTLQNEQLLNQNAELTETVTTLNETLCIVRAELSATREELLLNSDNNKEEIILSIYEVNSVGMTPEMKDKYFIEKFGFSYEQATIIFDYLKRNDDYEMGMRSLFFNDYETALYHFDLQLVKYPNDINSKMGKATALIGLGRTNESRDLILELEKVSTDKKFLYKLIGDSYCVDGNYSLCSEYYLHSLALYINEENVLDARTMDLVTNTCELKANGLSDTQYVTVFGPDSDGWKFCGVTLADTNQAITTRYKMYGQ